MPLSLSLALSKEEESPIEIGESDRSAPILV